MEPNPDQAQVEDNGPQQQEIVGQDQAYIN